MLASIAAVLAINALLLPGCNDANASDGAIAKPAATTLANPSDRGASSDTTGPGLGAPVEMMPDSKAALAQARQKWIEEKVRSVENKPGWKVLKWWEEGDALIITLEDETGERTSGSYLFPDNLCTS
jgi:hypothetical protein